MARKKGGILDILLVLTFIFVFTEILLLAIRYNVNGLIGTFYAELKEQLTLIYPHARLSTLTLLDPLIYFILAQLLVTVIYLYVLWYVTVSIASLFSLTHAYARCLAILLWAVSGITVFFANAYYVPHSFFSTFMQAYLFQNSLTPFQLRFILFSGGSICMLAAVLALLNMVYSFYHKCFRARHGIALSLALLTFIIFAADKHRHSMTDQTDSAATERMPNIFIIGFDALRPDYLSYFDKRHVQTPHFDNFLKASTVFTDAFTPDARTFPSWVSILSGKYPLHNKARDDNTDFLTLKPGTLLTGLLKQHGYQTLYASDDNRFNNINNKEFGFDYIIGPSGNAVDFLLGALNDFPFTNLLINTPAGKWLFPSLIASHASPHTYDPDSFLQTLDEGLRQLDRHKPVFLAAHFNMTGWPFYFYNDHQRYDARDGTLYKNTIKAADLQLEHFLVLLEQNGLLKHAIFILMSDHGITLQLPGDRIISESLYQGNKNDIKVNRLRYANIRILLGTKDQKEDNGEDKLIYIPDTSVINDPDHLSALLKKITSPTNPDQYGIDTSWGYGNDLLSLKQNHALLAFRIYGMTPAIPHHVHGRSLLLDIAPTLMDLLNLEPISQHEGASLKPYLLNPSLNLPDQRPVFLETSFTPQEIQHENISIEEVLEKNIRLYQINAENGLLSMTPSTVKLVTLKKQRAIIQGDWLLAYYPSSIRYRPGKHGQLENYIFPSYPVLVNLKTGKWTTKLNNPFAATAPLKMLSEQINHFYGNEMDNYKENPR